MLDHRIVNGDALTITPFGISTADHFWNAFDYTETEISARWIIRLCQKRGNWEPFSRGAVEDLSCQSRQDGFTFNKLLDRGWIVEREGLYHVTAGFIVRCFESSPAPASEGGTE